MATADHDKDIAPPYSFATHLLGAFSVVKAKNQHTIKTANEIAQMVLCRAHVEEEYAKQLQKMVAATNQTTGLKILGLAKANDSNHGTTGEASASTFHDCFDSIKADMLNKAVQRTQLSHSLLTEIYEPIKEIHDDILLQSQDLEERASQIGRELKTLDNRYRQSVKKFENTQQQAETSCRHLPEGTWPKIDPVVVYRKYCFAKQEHHSSTALQPSDFKREDSISSPAAIGTPISSSKQRFSNLTATAALINQVTKADLTSWLLPSGETHKDLFKYTRELMETVEFCRFACHDRYEELVVFAKNVNVHLQELLTEYQYLEEKCLDGLKIILEKQIVFESSCLANEQYEAQVLFKLIESMDKDLDLESFILTHRAQLPPPNGEIYLSNALQALNISSSSSLPLPPSLNLDPSIDIESKLVDETSHPPLIGSTDLPNLSYPAPHVLPSATVVRLLKSKVESQKPASDTATATATAYSHDEYKEPHKVKFGEVENRTLVDGAGDISISNASAAAVVVSSNAAADGGIEYAL